MDTKPNGNTPTDGSSSEIRTHRQTLVSTRDKVQRRYGLIYVFAVIGPFLGAMYGWYLYKTPSAPLFWVVPVVYGLLPMAMALSFRQRLRQIESDIQELDFQIDLQEFEETKREARAEKLLRLNDFQLRRYYDLNISQNFWVFALGIFCIILGVAVVITTLGLVIEVAQGLETKVITAVLGSIGAILSNFVAVIYLRMNSGATDNLKAFHSRLVETNQFLLGNLLASRIDADKERWETLSQLSLCLMKKGAD